MALRAVIFDYGKVLSALPDMDAHSALVEAAGVPDEIFEEHYWAHRHAFDEGTLNGQTYWQKVADGAAFELTPERLVHFHRHDSLMWSNLNAPMVAWARALQQHGIKTAILSNMGDVIHAHMQREFAWLAGFDHLTWSYELGIAKPDPAIYRHTLDKLGVAPEEALFIDDIPRNIAAARALGMDGIVFEDVAQIRGELTARGLEGAIPFPVLESTPAPSGPI